MSRELSYLKIIVFSFFNLLGLVCSPDIASASCAIDTTLTLFEKNQSCKRVTWGGFTDRNCCSLSFDNYIYALGKRANLTGQMFLNATQQQNCLSLMQTPDEKVLKCNIAKLTSGSCGCSDYTVMDAVSKLHNSLERLREDCRVLDSEAASPNQSCHSCFTTWEGITKYSDNGVDLDSDEANICRFAVLIALTSEMINEKKWIKSVFQCLGEQQNLYLNEGGSKDGGSSKLKTGLWILIGGAVGIIVIITIASCILLKGKNERIIQIGTDGRNERIPSKSRDVSEYSISEELSCLKLSIKEIYSATNNLHPSNFIGQGIAGKVYKGILGNGEHVAVKHIINDGYMDTFVREVTSMSDVRHPNLVSLLGYCENEDECFLVYELCHNGNLSQWLFGKDKVLSWTQRLEIAIDSARGLWFLHTYPEGCIVHRDIKPTNILLGADFQGKLSDFGLSKVMEVGQSFVSSEVRGTFGYVDPEYRRNHRVNASGDVYSFGMVLLQLLSGHRVIDMNLNRPMPLGRLAKTITRGGKLADFADPRLQGEFSNEAFDLVLKLALSCTGLKQQRPSMEQVVSRLEKALYISIEEKSRHSLAERDKCSD